MFISQENPVVKANNFESNRNQAEKARIATSVEDSPGNRAAFDQTVESPTKLSNPMQDMDETPEGTVQDNDNEELGPQENKTDEAIAAEIVM